VVALLGMVVLIAAPAVTEMGKNQTLEIAARNLAFDMRKSQQKAITAGWTQTIEFRDHLNEYRLKDGKTGDYIKVDYPEGIYVCANNFPGTGSLRTLSFTRSGAPNQGGTLALENSTGKILYIILTPATGRVRVSEQPPDNW